MIKTETKYSPGSSEQLIHDTLPELVTAVKEKMYTDDFKRSSNFKSEDCELDTLGAIISKYCEYDPSRIEMVMYAAFVAANCPIKGVKYI